ncbi:MAG: DMT family transporter [Candidatus Methanofastidiosia archaeon]
MHHDRKGELATLASALLWGSSFAAIKMGLAHIDPIPFVILRFIFATLFSIVIYASMQKSFKLSIFKNRYIYFMGFFNAVGFLFQYLGLDLTTAIKTSLLININLIFVMTISHFYLGEVITPRKLFSVAGGVIGIFLLITGGDLTALKSGYLLGDIMVLLAGFSWSVYIVLSRKIISEGADIFELNYMIMLITALILLPFGIGSEFHITEQNLIFTLYVALFCTTIPSFCGHTASKQFRQHRRRFC